MLVTSISALPSDPRCTGWQSSKPCRSRKASGRPQQAANRAFCLLSTLGRRAPEALPGPPSPDGRADAMRRLTKPSALDLREPAGSVARARRQASRADRGLGGALRGQQQGADHAGRRCHRNSRGWLHLRSQHSDQHRRPQAGAAAFHGLHWPRPEPTRSQQARQGHERMSRGRLRPIGRTLRRGSRDAPGGNARSARHWPRRSWWRWCAGRSGSG